MSGGTAGPRTTCPGGHLVRGDSWSSDTGVPQNYSIRAYLLHVLYYLTLQIPVSMVLTNGIWRPKYLPPWCRCPFAAALAGEGAVGHSYTHSLVAEASTAVGRGIREQCEVEPNLLRLPLVAAVSWCVRRSRD